MPVMQITFALYDSAMCRYLTIDIFFFDTSKAMIMICESRK